MAVDRLDCDRTSERMVHVLTLAKRIEVRARIVVIASGARYRRPDVDALEDFEGNGVSYWASPIEAQACAGQEVALVGGGNSAGQAAVFLAPSVRKLHLVARQDHTETMSAYRWSGSPPCPILNTISVVNSPLCAESPAA